jgi:hypothetical protein
VLATGGRGIARFWVEIARFWTSVF